MLNIKIYEYINIYTNINTNQNIILIVGISIFVLGIVGYISWKESLFQLALALELILLGSTLLVVGATINELEGEILSLILIVLAGVESIVGLTIILNHYRYYL